MMRILLAGGSGQLGSELRRSLSPFGEIVAPPRAVLDLAEADSIVRAVREVQPRIIVNAAAYAEVDRAESDQDAAMKVNGIAPGLLAEEAARCAASLVHYSTGYVFDGCREEPYREEDPTRPVNVYGASKLAGEQAVLAARCPHLVFRTSGVYGVRGRNFFLAILRRAREGARLEVVDDQYVAPTPARFIADATARILVSLAERGVPEPGRMQEAAGLYHMTAAGRTSWHEFAVEILHGMRIAAAVFPVSSASRISAAKRPSNSVLDNSRLRTRFGISLPDWRIGLQACLEELGKTESAAR